MENEYTIRTLQDMIDATNEENLQRFLEDLEIFLRTAHAFKEYDTDSFVWCDDGKNEYHVIVKTENENEKP